MNLDSELIGLTLIVWFVTLGFVVAWRRALRSVNWPSTKGEIESSCVVGGHSFDSGTRYQLKVRYRYLVGGKEYKGYQIGFFGPSGSKAELMRICDQFPVGKVVDVFYDPKGPVYSVLWPGIEGSIWIVLVAMVGLNLFVAVGWWVELR